MSPKGWVKVLGMGTRNNPRQGRLGWLAGKGERGAERCKSSGMGQSIEGGETNRNLFQSKHTPNPPRGGQKQKKKKTRKKGKNSKTEEVVSR